jgi:hypothetical protein
LNEDINWNDESSDESAARISTGLVYTVHQNSYPTLGPEYKNKTSNLKRKVDPGFVSKNSNTYRSLENANTKIMKIMNKLKVQPR